MEYSRVKKAYNEIINVIKKHEDLCKINLSDVEDTAKSHLFAIELEEKYGISIPGNVVPNINYTKLGDFITIGRWGNGHMRNIEYEDDGKQPTDEYLVEISFPGGPYVLGNARKGDYPEDDFQDMFLELKSYGPQYVDTTNSCLYYTLDNAGRVVSDFQKIFDKYYQICKSKSKEREIQRLKKRIEELSG